MAAPGRASLALKLTGVLIGALVLSACGASRPQAETPSGSRRIRVVSTFQPITLFTRAVAGDCATVTALVPPDMSPHDFQARPGDLVELGKARVLVKNGLKLESFLDKLVAAAGNTRLVVIDSSRGIATLEGAGSAGGDATVHAHDHAHGPTNPHIWLDPLRAVRQVNNIRDALVRADPGCAAGYRRNAAAFTDRLRELHSRFSAQLKPYAGRTFIAFHDFAPYFAERYGLRVESLVDVPEINPSPADLQRVAARVKRSRLRALLSEPQKGNRSFNALARDLGVQVSEFDPMETGSEQDAHDPDSYLRVMRRNVSSLLQALGP